MIPPKGRFPCVKLYNANKKRNAVKVRDVKAVKHWGQKCKISLAEDGTVYKVKRSKLENTKSWTLY